MATEVSGPQPGNIDESLRVPRIRAAAVVVRDGAILLVRHEKDGRSYWLLPGGGVDFGEATGEALAREVREETGLDVVVRDVLFIQDAIAPDGRRHIVNLYFRTEIRGGQLAPGPDGRLTGVRFVPLDQLDCLTLYPDIRAELRAAIRDGFPCRAPYLGNRWTE